MKVRIEKKALADALAWVAAAVPKRPRSPVLTGIKVSAEGDEVVLRAFDYDIGHTARVPADVVTEGGALVSGHFLGMIVAGLQGATVELVVDRPNLLISSGRSSFRARLMVAEDYPALPDFPPRVGIVDGDVLEGLIKATSAPATDDGPFEQTIGLHLESDDAGLWAVGAPSTPTSVHAAVAEWVEDAPFSTTVPSAGLIAAVKGLSGSVELAATEGVFALRDNTRTVTLRTFTAEYLRGQWRGLLKNAAAKSAYYVTTDAAALAGALKRAAALGGDGKEGYVGLVIEPDSITVTGHAEIGDGEEVIEADGNASTYLGMNANLAVMGLAAVGGRVSIGVPVEGEMPPSKPLYLTPADSDAVQVVVMPRRWMGDHQ